jgi:hypothetical protein
MSRRVVATSLDRTRGRPIQARTATQDANSVATRFACSFCQITYYVPLGLKAQCPLCEAERRVKELQAALMVLKNQLEQSENSAARLRTTVDITVAMRDALDITNAKDLTFLKSVLYRYRADRSAIGLRVTHGSAQGTGRRQHAPANGFLALPRGGEPEAHLCSSAGGVAIAGYFEEAARTSGLPYAMTTIMRAVNPSLTGATPE